MILQHCAFLDSYHQQEQSQHAISKMSSRRIISFNLRKFSTQSTFRFTYKCQLSFILILWKFFLTTNKNSSEIFQDFWSILKSIEISAATLMWKKSSKLVKKNLNFLPFRESKTTCTFAHFCTKYYMITSEWDNHTKTR